MTRRKRQDTEGGPVETTRRTAAPSQDSQDTDLARATLRAVCQDAEAPAAARAQAARTLAEMAGALGRHAAPPGQDSKPLSAMSRAELERELARAAAAE